MWKILGGIVLFSMVLAAFKIAIILLILAGLIFRTKEMLGLLAIGAGFALLQAQPAVGLGVIALIAILALYASKNKAGSDAS